MRSLLSLLFRLVLLAVFTFAFVVLFEHGPAKFSDGAKREWNALLSFAGSLVAKQTQMRIFAQPTATPEAAPTARSSPVAKAAPTAAGTNRPPKDQPTPNR
ncbi:MAG TPA: hypothetical protein VIT23_07315 [Terrimicrobiaceae bacterium]